MDNRKRDLDILKKLVIRGSDAQQVFWDAYYTDTVEELSKNTSAFEQSLFESLFDGVYQELTARLNGVNAYVEDLSELEFLYPSVQQFIVAAMNDQLESYREKMPEAYAGLFSGEKKRIRKAKRFLHHWLLTRIVESLKTKFQQIGEEDEEDSFQYAFAVTLADIESGHIEPVRTGSWEEEAALCYSHLEKNMEVYLSWREKYRLQFERTYPYLHEAEWRGALNRALLAGNEEEMEEAFLKYIKSLHWEREKYTEEYETVAGIANQDPQAMTKIFSKYQRSFYKIAGGKYWKAFPEKNSEIEDAFQDSLVVVIENYILNKKIRVQDDWILGLKSPLLNLVIKIGLNLLSRRLEKKDRPGLYDFEELIRGLDLSTPDADVKTSQLETQRVLLKALQMLSKKDHELLKLKYFAGYSYREIAEMMGYAGADSARQICLRARRRVKKHIKQFLDKEGENGNYPALG